MKAFLLAAGFGTRLRPFTYTLPKPMMPVLSRPLIGWIVEHAMGAGVREFIVNLHHLPETLERYLPAAFPHASFTFSQEEKILGTGGALRKMRALLEDEEDFFLANGDTIQRPPFAELRAARREADALAALTLRHSPEEDHYTQVWLDDPLSVGHDRVVPNRRGRRNDEGSARRSGALQTKGMISGFGNGTGEPLMFSGSHCISRRLFDLLPDRPFSGIVDDVYKRTSEPLAGVVIDDPFWFDIGTPQRYLGATQAMLGGESRIEPTARVRGELTRSVAGARSVVDGTLAGSVVWDDVHVAAGVRLTNCIVGHGVELAAGQYTNVMICKDNAAIPAAVTRQGGLVVEPF